MKKKVITGLLSQNVTCPWEAPKTLKTETYSFIAKWRIREQDNTNCTNEQEKDHIEDLVLDGDLKLILWLSYEGL